MGYRSDILIAVAFLNKEQRDEAWAVYCMDARVVSHGVAKWWTADDTGAYPVLWYEDEGVKWYDSFGDVQGVEHLIDVASTFAKERKHPFAYIHYRIGEELNDVEVIERADDPDGVMLSYLYDRCDVERRITHSFK